MNLILEKPTLPFWFIPPRYQRQGLGQALLLALLMVASERAWNEATLEIELLTGQPCLCIKAATTVGGGGVTARLGRRCLGILWRGDLPAP